MKGIINGAGLAWDDNGSGPAVCLVHGFPLNRCMWDLQSEALLKAGFRVIAPDLRGFGDSDAPDGPCSMDLYADDLAALCGHLGIERLVVGGMSMGGYVLLDLLERYPGLVAAACFIVTRSGPDDAAGREKRRTLAAEVLKEGAAVAAERFQKILFAPGRVEERPELAAEVHAWMMGNKAAGLSGALLAMAGRKDYTPLLGSFTIPSLVIGAAEDQAIPVAESRALAGALPHAQLCIVPKGGHLANLEEPDAFNHCLISFLKSLNQI